MPLYEYRCQKCGHVMEVLQKVSDRPLRRCRACSGKVEKMISRTAFLLKGGGWFNEGYSKGAGGAREKPAGKTDGDKGDKGDKGEKSKKPAKKKKEAAS